MIPLLCPLLKCTEHTFSPKKLLLLHTNLFRTDLPAAPGQGTFVNHSQAQTPNSPAFQEHAPIIYFAEIHPPHPELLFNLLRNTFLLCREHSIAIPQNQDPSPSHRHRQSDGQKRCGLQLPSTSATPAEEALSHSSYTPTYRILCLSGWKHNPKFPIKCIIQAHKRKLYLQWKQIWPWLPGCLQAGLKTLFTFPIGTVQSLWATTDTFSKRTCLSFIRCTERLLLKQVSKPPSTSEDCSSF